MSIPSFSCCVICKNMANTIPRLMDSLREFQERGGRVVVLDTGSTDQSVEAFRSRGAEVTEVGDRFMIEIDSEMAKAINNRFVVDDEEPIVQEGSRLFHFANARNFCASLATNDWISWADADEAFTVLDLDKIEQIIADPGLEHVEYSFVFAHGPDGVSPAVEFTQSKMYRRSRMFWTGAVHELVTPLPGAPPRQGTGPNRLYLTPDIFRLEHWQEPRDHRSAYCPGLGYDAWMKMDHRDDLAGSADRQAHYLGREMTWLGRPKSAIKLLKEHVAMNGWPAERSESMVFVGDCYGQLNQPELQAEWYSKAYYADSTRRVALLRLANFFKGCGNHHAAAAYASAALEIPWHPFYANQMREYRAGPYEVRYHARGWMGNIAGAQEDILKVLTMEPFNPEANRDVAFYFDYDTNTAPEGWMVAPELLFLHDNAKGKKRILEVGSWKGRSTHALCTGAGKTGGTVYAVDHFGGSAELGDQTHGADADAVYAAFLENTKQFENLVVFRGESAEAAAQFPDGFFDMVFIDAEHTGTGVSRDIALWKPKCRALLSGHDFSPTWPDLMAGVRASIGEPAGVNCSIWWKPVEPPPANPLLLYMTQMVREGKPCSFVKRGDGEELAMAGEKGANCDGHPYSQELAWKLKMAFSSLEKMTAPRKGRTWVNVVPFADQGFFNCILHRPDNVFDAVKAFWGAVRESTAHKVFVGPARLQGVADLLKAGTFVEVPLVNAFAEYYDLRERLMWHAKSGAIFVFCAGFVSKVLIANLLERQPNMSCIDAGSAFDPLFLDQPSRTMQLPKWLLEREYAEWMR